MKFIGKKYSKLEIKNFKWIFLFLLPSLIVFILFYLNPIVTIFVTSFTKWDGFNNPEFINVKNYLDMFKDSTFRISLWNLIKWSLLASTVHVAIGVIIAFILFYKKPGWRFTRSVYMIPNVISAAAWVIIYKFIFNDSFGIVNTLIRKINPDWNVQWFYQSPYAFWAVTFTWLFYSMYVTLVVYNDLLAIPTELTEAAKIDGASSWQINFKVYLPLCRTAIGTGVIMSVTSRISMYEQIVLTTTGGPGDDTMNLPLILVNSINDLNYGYANAIGVVMFIIGIATLLLVNKTFKMDRSVYGE